MVVILFLTGSISRWLAIQGSNFYGYDFKLLSGTCYFQTACRRHPAGFDGQLEAMANDLFLGASGLIYGYTGEFSNASTSSISTCGH